MRRKLLFVFAFLGIISAVTLVKKTTAPPPKPSLVIQPPPKPFSHVVAASGIIEPWGESFSIGSSESGVVEEVYVNVGDVVKPGDRLFSIDSRHLNAELKINEAKVEVALAEHRLIHDQLLRLQKIGNPKAISQDQLRSKENEERLAQAKLFQAKMEQDKTKALLERLLVRSPIEGVVLQKNIKKGGYLTSADSETASLVLGNTRLLQIRADIDEQNAAWVLQGAAGVAYPKNRSDIQIPLSFVRIDPYVIPKKSLTGSSKEKVDTRVLQVIYTFEPPKEFSLYIGQQVDVFIQRSQEKLIAERP